MTNIEYLRQFKDYEDLLIEIQLRDEEIERLKKQLDECWAKRGAG